MKHNVLDKAMLIATGTSVKPLLNNMTEKYARPYVHVAFIPQGRNKFDMIFYIWDTREVLYEWTDNDIRAFKSVAVGRGKQPGTFIRAKDNKSMLVGGKVQKAYDENMKAKDAEQDRYAKDVEELTDKVNKAVAKYGDNSEQANAARKTLHIKVNRLGY